MTYDESTLFMKFMQGKGVMNNFDYLYRSHRFDKRDLSQYLDEVDAEDVIMKAFDFTGAGNTIFGLKYWKDIDQKWQAYLTEFRNTGILTADEAQVYCPHCQRVLPRTAFATKSNGVLHKHCKECEGGKWDREKKEREKAEKEAEKQTKAMKQLEKEIAEKQAKLERLADATTPELTGKIIENGRAETARLQIADGQANLDKTTKVCGHCGKRKLRTEFYKSDASEDGLQEYCKTCQTELLAAAEEAQHREDEKRRLEIEIAEREAEVQRMKQEDTGTVPMCDMCDEEDEQTLPEPEKRKRKPGVENLLEYLPTVFTEAMLSKVRKENGMDADGTGRLINVWRCRGYIALMQDGTYSKTTKYVGIKKKFAETAFAVSSTPMVMMPDKLVAPKLGEYDATLHYKQNQKSITFNATLSAQIREGEFSKCYLNIDRSKHAFLIFNRVEGANVTGASSLTQTLLNVTSADIARKLAARFNLALGDNYYLHITKNLSKKDEFLTVEVLQARTREEYIKIAERREQVAKGKIPPYEAEEDIPEDAANSEQDEPANSEASTEPLLDFGDAHLDMKDPAAILDFLTENGYITERDLAVYLHQKGWELQEPVIVKKLKKFSV